jgi:hypothetical protein
MTWWVLSATWVKQERSDPIVIGLSIQNNENVEAAIKETRTAFLTKQTAMEGLQGNSGAEPHGAGHQLQSTLSQPVLAQ